VQYFFIDPELFSIVSMFMKQVGDQLIAVDHFNTSDASAKITQRMMGTLSWPRVLVFETK
jgi:hypothetical protein